MSNRFWEKVRLSKQSNKDVTKIIIWQIWPVEVKSCTVSIIIIKMKSEVIEQYTVIATNMPGTYCSKTSRYVSYKQ